MKAIGLDIGCQVKRAEAREKDFDKTKKKKGKKEAAGK